MIAFCNFFSTWWNLNFNTRYLVEIQTKKKKMFWCNNYKLHKLNSHWQLLEWEQGEIHYVYLMESLLSTWHSNVMKEKLHWIGSCTVVEFMGKCFTTLSAVRLKPMSLPQPHHHQFLKAIFYLDERKINRKKGKPRVLVHILYKFRSSWGILF